MIIAKMCFFVNDKTENLVNFSGENFSSNQYKCAQWWIQGGNWRGDNWCEQFLLWTLEQICFLSSKFHQKIQYFSPRHHPVWDRLASPDRVITPLHPRWILHWASPWVFSWNYTQWNSVFYKTIVVKLCVFIIKFQI